MSFKSFLLFSCFLFGSLASYSQTYVSNYQTNEKTSGSGLAFHDLISLMFDTLQGKLVIGNITYFIVPKTIVPIWGIKPLKEFVITSAKDSIDSGKSVYQEVIIEGGNLYENYKHYHKQIILTGLDPYSGIKLEKWFYIKN